MAQLYPVTCDCGRTHQVPGSLAGSDLACGCGRAVAVPSLQRLRVAAGEPPASAEVMIEAYLLAGRLPEETDCQCCGLPTPAVAHVTADCERVEVRGGKWAVSVVALLFGWIYATREAPTERGRDVRYRLPLRICPGCAPALGRAGVRDAVLRVPLYRQLFEKYPQTRLSALAY